MKYIKLYFYNIKNLQFKNLLLICISVWNGDKTG